jgi:hypothetical protein
MRKYWRDSGLGRAAVRDNNGRAPNGPVSAAAGFYSAMRRIADRKRYDRCVCFELGQLRAMLFSAAAFTSNTAQWKSSS